jgi:hypothetical protein
MTTNLKSKSHGKGMPLGVYTGTAKPITVLDPIYPRKSEVHVGSQFSFHGHRLGRPVHYTVEAIYTIGLSESGRPVEMYTAHVKYLNDLVMLRCEETRQSISRTFKWLSVSSAWRLEMHEKSYSNKTTRQ